MSPTAAFKSLRLLCRFWVLCWSHTICVFLFGWSFLCLSDAPFERTISHRARPLGERQEEATISADISTPTTRAAITLIESTSYSANIYAARLFMYMCDWTLWVYIVYTFSCGSFQSYIYIYIVIESTSPQSNKHTKTYILATHFARILIRIITLSLIGCRCVLCCSVWTHYIRKVQMKRHNYIIIGEQKA